MNTSVVSLDQSIRAEIARQRRAIEQDAARYNVLKAAIVVSDAELLNELTTSRENFDDVLDAYGRKLISSYYAKRKGA